MLFGAIFRVVRGQRAPETDRAGIYAAVEVACEGDPAKLQAWKYGDWRVISGGASDGIFFEQAKTIYVEPFELPSSGKF
jgi:hypothetical protein